MGNTLEYCSIVNEYLYRNKLVVLKDIVIITILLVVYIFGSVFWSEGQSNPLVMLSKPSKDYNDISY